MKSPREAIKQAMQKLPKDDPRVEYSDRRGKPDHHCGPSLKWPTGFCRFYQSGGFCEKVTGAISPSGGCDLYEKAKGA